MTAMGCFISVRARVYKLPELTLKVELIDRPRGHVNDARAITKAQQGEERRQERLLDKVELTEVIDVSRLDAR